MSHITHNPCRQVKGKPEGKGRKRVFTADEKSRFLEACKHSKWDKFYCFVLLGFTTGARKGELFKLTWDLIALTDKTAFCRDTKNGEDKILHLIDAVITQLQKFREVGNGIVFTSSGRKTFA